MVFIKPQTKRKLSFSTLEKDHPMLLKNIFKILNIIYLKIHYIYIEVFKEKQVNQYGYILKV